MSAQSAGNDNTPIVGEQGRRSASASEHLDILGSTAYKGATSVTTQQMLISDILAAHPEAVSVFERHGLACGACVAARMESLTSVATVHDVSVERIVAELNDLVASGTPPVEGE